MDILALIADYLSDQEEGMKNLITWFLNQVMLIEALQQAGAARYERTDARLFRLSQRMIWGIPPKYSNAWR